MKATPLSRTSIQQCCLNVATYRYKIHKEKIQIVSLMYEVDLAALVASLS